MRRAARHRGALALALLAAAACGFASEPLASLICSVRFEAPRAGMARAALAWGDSMVFAVDIPAAAHGDEDYGVELSYSYLKGDSVLARGSVPCRAYDPAAVSVVLRAWSSGAAVETGTDRRGAVVPVAFDCLAPDSVAVLNPSGLRVLNHTLIVEPAAPVEFADTSALASVWTYLDRDTDPEAAFPGGFYRLGLTQPDSAGIRRLVYLAGAREQAGAWPPGRVKATLRPTGFAGHFDLGWITASGRRAPAECFADLDEETGILSVSFPLLRSRMRFRRVQ